MSEIGVGDEGVAGDTEATAPGAGGVGPTAVLLSDPGSTTVSESWMLGLVLGSMALESAKSLCNNCQCVWESFRSHVIRDFGSDSMAQAIEDSVSSQSAQEPFFCPVTGLSATSCATQPTAMEYNGGASSYNFRPGGRCSRKKTLNYVYTRLASFVHQAWRPVDMNMKPNRPT